MLVDRDIRSVYVRSERKEDLISWVVMSLMWILGVGRKVGGGVYSGQRCSILATIVFDRLFQIKFVLGRIAVLERVS